MAAFMNKLQNIFQVAEKNCTEMCTFETALNCSESRISDAALDGNQIFDNIFIHYCVPILTGSVGNILSILVFHRMKLRKFSSSYYLSVLCIAATFFLLAALAHHYFKNVRSSVLK